MKRLSLLLCSGLMACASTDLPSSGLLGDTSGFKQRGDDLLVEPLSNPDSLRGYTKVHIERVLVYLRPEARERGVTPAQQRDLAQLFRTALRTEMGEHFTLVDDPSVRADDLLIVRAAITDAEPGDPATGGPGNGTIEVEVIDSNSRDRRAAAISRKSVRKVGDTAEEKEAEAGLLFDQWARALREWLVGATGS